MVVQLNTTIYERMYRRVYDALDDSSKATAQPLKQFPHTLQ